MAKSSRVDASYRDFGTGTRFCVDWMPPPMVPLRGALLLLPAFGEEMNKCRRQVAVAARRFAEAGYQVRAVDAIGTGDSAGDFGDASWAAWVADFRAAAAHLVETSAVPVIHWGVRAGSLIAAALADSGSPALLWQPVVSGDQQLTQLLRLKVANDAFAGKAAPATTKDLRARLEAGESLEVAGYVLNPRLVLPMAASGIATWAAGVVKIAWIETGAEVLTGPPPGSARSIAAMQARGADVTYAHVVGEPFWMTLEIAENIPMIDRSLAWLEGSAP
ncbi:MAG: hydrolase 2, exosortase A system-associated [Burkholderiales bacterium]|nr:hydrolase 2, exosortase A system-associated [Burkholderiales bacterium]